MSGAYSPERVAGDVRVRLRVLVYVIMGCVTLAVWLAGAGVAFASGWSIQRAAVPAQTPDSELFGVSCASRTACTAVGIVTNRSGTGLTLAERWSGGTWSIQRTPQRAVGSGLLGGLEDVSCPSVSVCITVGSADARALAARWNGFGWSAQAIHGLADGTDLQSVSCASQRFCIAVGWGISGATLVARFDGNSWRVQQTPQPAGARSGTLSGVSCASPTQCIAVGYYTSRAGMRVALTERWDGLGWAIQQTPQPAGANGNSLFGVSCATVTACTAVGDFTTHAGAQVPLGEQWDGTGWSIQQTPQPAGAKGSSLFAVSCQTVTSCTAVGSLTNHAGAGVTLAERWQGLRWSIRRTPVPAGWKDSLLDGVSCTTATACTAVGSFTNRAGTTVPLAERFS